MFIIVQPDLANIGGALSKGPGAGPGSGVGGWIAWVPDVSPVLIHSPPTSVHKEQAAGSKTRGTRTIHLTTLARTLRRCYASPALSRSSVTLSVGKVGDLEYVEQFGVPVSGAFGYVGVAVAVIDDKDEEQDCLH